MSEKIFTNLKEVMEEIDRHDLATFEQMPVESEPLRLAVEYLHCAGKIPMAEDLEKMAESGQIRLGPLKGFIASAYVKNGQEYIVISNQYEKYNSRSELVCDLVHEMHCLPKFNLVHESSEALELNIFQWLKKREDAIKKAFEKVKDRVV